MKKLMTIFFLMQLILVNVGIASNNQELRMSLNDTFRVQETDIWKVDIIKSLPLRFADVKITSKRGYNFNMMLYFKCDTKDLSQFDTPEKIAENIKKSSVPYFPFTIEKKATLKTVPVKSTYGFYTVLTDAELAKKTSRAQGEFKYLTRGMVRLSTDSALGFSIMTNDVNSKKYNELLAYVYSFVKL